MTAIKTTGLTKHYPPVTAVNDLNLEIQKGELFALLGVNGAGKTTTIKMLTGLTKPTAGTAYVGGFSITDPSGPFKKLIIKPEILFLDEPTLGLGVITRHELWEMILSLKGNVTIILTTHYLEEAKALSDRIGIMKNGTLLMVGTVDKTYRKSNKRRAGTSY